MTLCRVIAPFNHSPQIQARILIGSVRALSGTFHDFRASGGNFRASGGTFYDIRSTP